MSPELEQYFISTLEQEYPDLPSHTRAFKPLIPVHDPAKYDASASPLPSLHDDGSETGNLRYWVISNESMWAGQHRALDEMAETLWSLHHLHPGLAPSPASRHMQRWHRRRPRQFQNEDLGDSLLFRRWALPTAPPPYFAGWPSSARSDLSHPLFSPTAVRYPFRDGLFWREGDEGAWGRRGDGVPEWRDGPARTRGRNTPAEDFYDPNDLGTGRVESGGPAGLRGQGELQGNPFYRNRLHEIDT